MSAGGDDLQGVVAAGSARRAASSSTIPRPGACDHRRAADRAGGERRRASHGFAKTNIIANPNCSTAQLVVALKPLHDKATHQARRGVDLPVGVGRRQGRAWTSCSPRPGRSSCRTRRDQEVPQAHRLQRHSADRRLHGGRLHQGRVEDDGRDQEDPRPEDQAHRHLRARAGLHRPFGGGQHRVRATRSRPTRRATSCARRRAASSSTSARTAATSPRTRRRARTRPTSRASARTRRSRTASPSGASPTTCARARRSTPSRSPRVLVNRKLIAPKQKAA